MHENRMDTGDLYDFAFFNCFNPSAYIAPVSTPNRHQRHQTKHRERDASQTSHNGISVADLQPRAVRAQLIEFLPSPSPGRNRQECRQISRCLPKIELRAVWAIRTARRPWDRRPWRG